MGRSPCCDKAAVKRGPWSSEEDARLRSYIERHGGVVAAAGGGGWMALPREAGLRRCGKSCRLRWLNYLRPGVRHGGFSADEDRVICALYAAVGSRWSLIAAQLPGRTDNGVKNHWNTRLKKRFHFLCVAAGMPPPPPPWTETGLPYGTGGGVDDMRIGAAAGGGEGGTGDDDDMVAAGTACTNAVVVSQLPVETSLMDPPATTELDEMFRSSMGTMTGGDHSDVGMPYMYW